MEMKHPHNMLKQLLVHPKDAIDLEKKTNVVYQLPCSLCSASYIRQTSWALVEKGDTSISSVAEHVWLQGHQMDFRNYTILAQEADRHQWSLGLFSAKTILTVSWDCYPQYITASFHRFNF